MITLFDFYKSDNSRVQHGVKKSSLLTYQSYDEHMFTIQISFNLILCIYISIAFLVIMLLFINNFYENMMSDCEIFTGGSRDIVFWWERG